jgi:hypothetical protein
MIASESFIWILSRELRGLREFEVHRIVSITDSRNPRNSGLRTFHKFPTGQIAEFAESVACFRRKRDKLIADSLQR